MTTPRRYVRVTRELGVYRHCEDGALTRARYSRWKCICQPLWGHDSPAHADAITAADKHARTCPTVAAAMERDQLRAELDRMRADRDRLRDRLHQINPLNKDNE